MQQHIERIAKGSSVPRNGKEGILFSFIMSAIMIYVMAALNYGVRIGDVGAVTSVRRRGATHCSTGRWPTWSA